MVLSSTCLKKTVDRNLPTEEELDEGYECAEQLVLGGFAPEIVHVDFDKQPGKNCAHMVGMYLANQCPLRVERV